MSLFTDNVCNTLLDYLQSDPDFSVRLFALIALEKFAMTGQNKNKIITSGRDMQKTLQNIAEELHPGESSTDDMNRRRQLKFCVEWAMKNTFGMIPYCCTHEAMASFLWGSNPLPLR